MFIKQIADEIRPDYELANMRESLAEVRDFALNVEGQNIRLEETIADLQIAIEDQGWLNMEWRGGQLEFDRSQLENIIRYSRLSFLKNPLINRGANIQALYVWGQGVDVRTEDAGLQKALDEFWQNPLNESELSGHQARYMKECDLQVTGNLFFVLPTTDDGVVVRTIPVEEIADIITNPEDRRDVWYFKRVWTTTVTDLESGEKTDKTSSLFYPALGFNPDTAIRRAYIGGVEVKWDYPIFHVRVGGLSDMRFGLPETYQALDWARAYTKFLENCATLMKKLSKYAFTLDVKGGKPAVAAAKARLGTAVTASNSIETNPPALTGSTFIQSDGVKLDPIKTSGVGISPEDGRYFRLMAAAAMGLPETFFGDADVGNHATSKTLDRPTELKFTDRQHLWKHIIGVICGHAVQQATSRIGNVIDIDTQRKMPKINVNFPPILQHDVLSTVQAISQAATLGGYAKADTLPDEELSRALMSALGFQNIDELLKTLEDQVAQHKAEADAQQQSQNDQAMALVQAKGGQPAVPSGKAKPGVKQVAEALAEFRESLAEIARGMRKAA